MAIKNFRRSKGVRMLDEFLMAVKAFRFPVFTDAPTLNGAKDEPGYAGLKDDNIMVYLGGGVWKAVGSDPMYTGASPASKQVGGVQIGDDLTVFTHGQLLQKILAPYVLPTITCTLLTPSPSQYNAVNVVYSIAYQWAPNVGTTNLTTAQIQYKRSTSPTWINLTTAVTGTTNKIATATVTLNTGGPNNDGVDTRVIFTDATQANTSAVNTATFLAYVAPSVTLSIGTTTRERGDISTTITGTITRNSPNIALTNYQLQYQVNGAGSWIDFGSLVSASGSSQAIASITHNNTALNTSNALSYRALVTDAQTATPAGNAVINFFYRLWYGTTASAPASSSDVRAISNTQLTNAGNTFTIDTGITNTNFVIILPPGKSLVSVLNVENSNQNITGEFTGTTISVNDAGGTAVSYTMYKKTSSIPFNPLNHLAVTIA